MLSPNAELLRRHRALWAPADKQRLVVFDSFPTDAALFADAKLVFTNAGHQRQVQRQVGRGECTHVYTEAHDVAVLYFPKGKRRQSMMLAMARACAPRVVLVGSKREGIKSARKTVAAFGRITARESGQHRQLLVAELDTTEFRLDAFERRYRHADLEVVTLPGVFSDDGLDAGTALLLEHLEVEGRVLDLGCGAGPIGTMLAKRGCEVVMSDVDAVAAESARRTAVANDVSLSVLATDGYARVSRRFDAIVSNPPFHAGVDTEYDVTRTLITEAPQHLTPDGALWIVYNRFLPWAEPLESTFHEVDVLADNGRFRVARARRPKAAS